MSFRLRHPAYFLVAFIAACLAWYAATGKRRATISVRSAKANLTLVNLPSDIILTSTVPDTLNLQLRGPLPVIGAASASMEVYLDLSEARPGEHVYPIDLSGISVPPEVEIIAADPSEIKINLERLRIRSLPVRPQLEGRPAPGFKLGVVRVQPETVRIQGPDQKIAGMESLQTLPISIEGAIETLQLPVEIKLQDPFVRLLTPVPLKVRVEIIPEDDPANDGETKN